MTDIDSPRGIGLRQFMLYNNYYDGVKGRKCFYRYREHGFNVNEDVADYNNFVNWPVMK